MRTAFANPLQILVGIVVGYNIKDSRTGLNWYTPQFQSVGFTTTDINDINLDDGFIGTDDQQVGWGDMMQIVGPGGNPSKVYVYWDPSMDPNAEATKLYWGDDECNPVSVSFDKGDGIAIDNGNGIDYVIQNAGQVPDGQISFAARTGLNWSGNPFPAPIDINAINLDDGFIGTDDQQVGWGDMMQIVGPGGNPEKVYVYWDPSMDPNAEATKLYWGDDECNPVDVTLQPGDGFAIDNGNGIEYDITIDCPYAK